MRLIDADALLKDGITAEYGFGDDGLLLIPMRDVTNSIKIAPTVNAVPVVRCKDCERRNKSADLTNTVYCPWLKLSMRKEDFCSYGERKEGDD